MEYASTEYVRTNMQGWKMQVQKTQVQQLKEYFEEFTIFQSCIFSRSAVSRFSSPALYQTGVIHKKSDSCCTRAQTGLSSKIAGTTLSNLGKLFTPIVPQAAKLVAALLRVCRVTAGLAESNSSVPPGL